MGDQGVPKRSAADGSVPSFEFSAKSPRPPRTARRRARRRQPSRRTCWCGSSPATRRNRRADMASLRFDFSGETVAGDWCQPWYWPGRCARFRRRRRRGLHARDRPRRRGGRRDGRRRDRRDVSPLSCDITDAAAVRAALASIGRIDVLVNNAGLERITPLTDPDPEVEETFRRIIDINVNGTFLVTRHAVPKMQPGGRIILTASIWSRTAVRSSPPTWPASTRTSGLCGRPPTSSGRKHHRQRRLPGLGQDGSRHAVAQQHGAAVGPAGAAAAGRDRRRAGARRPARTLRHGPALPLFLASSGAKDITGQAYMLDRGEVMADRPQGIASSCPAPIAASAPPARGPLPRRRAGSPTSASRMRRSRRWAHGGTAQGISHWSATSPTALGRRDVRGDRRVLAHSTSSCTAPG